MKKILIATSALVAVAVAGQAQASEKIKLSVGGYMEQWAGIASQDDAFDNKNAFQSDTEIHFKGSTTLDNGIEVGAAIELEGESSSSMVDEQYLYINGSFGQIKLGQEDGAAADMGITAPAVGPVGVNDGDLTNWVSSNLADTVWDGGDYKRVTYYTPVLGGFRAGISYADSSASENADTTTGGNEVVSAGLEYNGDFDGFSLGLSAVGEHQGEGEWFSLGTNLGFGNFTVGASYGQKDKEFGFTEDGTPNGDDTTGFDIGVAYAMDAASVSLSYAHGESTDGTDGNDVDTVDLGLAYALGAGVDWKTSIFWFNSDSNTAANENDGYGAVTGIKLSF
ncbi:porin [Thalassospira sp. NFXS8]|uniref:porin n=1 Tax=Thalassospira sp. NFXS8 TaxID=2819093 RepID=UPI0032DE460A